MKGKRQNSCICPGRIIMVAMSMFCKIVGELLFIMYWLRDRTHFDIDVTFHEFHLSEQCRDEGRFPRADLTNDGHQTPLWHLQIDAVKGDVNILAKH